MGYYDEKSIRTEFIASQTISFTIRLLNVQSFLNVPLFKVLENPKYA